MSLGETISGVEQVDFLVIGSGIAGLTYALRTAAHGSTVILTKKDRAESSSNYAQGGIAGVMGEHDDASLHIHDTLVAGAGLCHEDAVQVLVSEGPDRIRELMALGARFSTQTGPDGSQQLALGQEGGHSRKRIVHAVDKTGWECERTLLKAAMESPNLRIHDDYFVVDLLFSNGPDRACVGAVALDPATGAMRMFRAKAVLLATGGCGQVYRHTTNPSIATGDGVAMAWRLGAAVANMEFVQFHPTSLYHPKGQSFLISEAVRGEGGRLRTLSGETFMDRYDPRAELAPRDIVARAIHEERHKRAEPCVLLDVTHLDADFLRHRFPTIHDRCLEFGIDITKQPIPVVPAAHYQCGGVSTDLDGRTSVPGLYAAGEVACTGVHGANRLASNSLLEAMVFGRRAADAAIRWSAEQSVTLTDAELSEASTQIDETPESASLPTQSALRDELRALMNDDAGIFRNTQDLSSALERIGELKVLADRLVRVGPPNPDTFELRNMTVVAELIVRSALSRHESRGLHYTADFPVPNEALCSDTRLTNASLH